MSEFIIKNKGIERILEHMEYWIEDSKKDMEIEYLQQYAKGKLLIAEFVKTQINIWKDAI